MNKTALIAALLCALLGVFLLVTYLRHFEDEEKGGTLEELVVANTQLDPGTVITEQMLSSREIPRKYVESRALRKKEMNKVIGMRISTAVLPQQIVMWTDFAMAADDKRDLSSLIQPGMRAVAVKATYDEKAEALLRPGDRVDVIASLPVEEKGEKNARQSIILLQNVLVLTVGLDASAESNSKGHQVSVQDLLVNLHCTIQQAQLLSLASEKGRLMLALRNPDDTAMIEGLSDMSSSALTDNKTRKNVQEARRLPVFAAPVHISNGGENQ